MHAAPLPGGRGVAFDAAVPDWPADPNQPGEADRTGSPAGGAATDRRASAGPPSAGRRADRPAAGGTDRRRTADRRQHPSDESWAGPERRAVDRRHGDRRQGDRRSGADRRSGFDRRGLLQQTMEFATRFKQPLIGLGVAAAALPIVGVVAGGAQAATPTAEQQASAQAQQASAASQDVDAQLGSHWGEAQRSTVVQAAVGKYGISSGLAGRIYDSAAAAGVDPRMAFGLIKTESNFKNTAVSNVGARGLTQLMPGTARWLAPGTTASDLFNPETSLRVGFRYLHQLIDRYHGNRQLALTAYNRGPGTVDAAVRRGRNPDNGYAGTVLGNALHAGDLAAAHA